MIKLYPRALLLIATGLFLTMFIASCKKDSSGNPATVVSKPLITLGLYEYQQDIYRRVFIPITQIGNVVTNYIGAFDTGSSAMTMDATGILPASMITSAGITVTGDSVVYNGITVTNKTAIVAYGDATDGTKEYGNLAYATIKIGNANGSITTKRIPFFLYYKAIDTSTGDQLEAHSNDVFGVGPETSFSGLKMSSPLSYLTGTGVTAGFKLATFAKASFGTNPTYVADLLTIGLVPDDLTSSSKFIMHSLTYEGANYGYSPDIPATVSYNGKSIAATMLFDTGNPAYANIEDPNASKTITTLPANSTVTISTADGFSYKYTTSSDYNLTQVINPSVSQDPRTIFSIDFFVENEFLLDYVNHKIGLKNVVSQ